MAQDYVTANFTAPTITKEKIDKIFSGIDFSHSHDLTFSHNLYGDWDIQPTGEEEWIWVTGYKGTDKDMKCRDYQYELGKQHDMPEGTDITMCYSGFHFFFYRLLVIILYAKITQRAGNAKKTSINIC